MEREISKESTNYQQYEHKSKDAIVKHNCALHSWASEWNYLLELRRNLGDSRDGGTYSYVVGDQPIPCLPTLFGGNTTSNPGPTYVSEESLRNAVTPQYSRSTDHLKYKT